MPAGKLLEENGLIMTSEGALAPRLDTAAALAYRAAFSRRMSDRW